MIQRGFVFGFMIPVLLLLSSPAPAGQSNPQQPVARGSSSKSGVEFRRDGRIVIRARGGGPARASGRTVARSSGSARRTTKETRAALGAEETSDNAGDVLVEGTADLMSSTSDALTSSALMFRLLAGGAFSVPDIDVDPTARDLRLLGAVSDQAAKNAAAAQAMDVAGVPSVRNELQVLSEWVPSAYLVDDDEHVQERVARALLARPALHAADIDVTVNQGITTLTGTVPTMDQRQLATTVAQTIPGVSVIMNELSLRSE